MLDIISHQGNVNQSHNEKEEFPGGLMVMTQHFHLCCTGLIPDLGTNIPYQATTPHGQKKKPTMRYHFNTLGMGRIEMSENSKCWQGGRKTEIFI